jgi:hypothetical protein
MQAACSCIMTTNGAAVVRSRCWLVEGSGATNWYLLKRRTTCARARFGAWLGSLGPRSAQSERLHRLDRLLKPPGRSRRLETANVAKNR